MELAFRTEAEIKVEKILDSWEDQRNQELLEEMNGVYCARHQLSFLHKHSFIAKTNESSEDFEARISAMLQRHPTRISHIVINRRGGLLGISSQS